MAILAIARTCSVAPPEDRLDPLELREPPMEAQHRSKLRVHASLDPVVRGRKRPFGRERGVQVREQGAGVGEPHRGRDRARREPLVRVDRAPVNHACAAPGNRPRSRTTARGRSSHQFGLRAGSLYAAAPCARPYSSMPACSFGLVVVLPLDLAERVEHASLHLRGGPLRARRRPRSRCRRRSPPPPARPRATEETVHAAVVSARARCHDSDELVAAGYQHHAVARHPYAVDVDDAAGLVVRPPASAISPRTARTCA